MSLSDEELMRSDPLSPLMNDDAFKMMMQGSEILIRDSELLLSSGQVISEDNFGELTSESCQNLTDKFQASAQARREAVQMIEAQQGTPRADAPELRGSVAFSQQIAQSPTVTAAMTACFGI